MLVPKGSTLPDADTERRQDDQGPAMCWAQAGKQGQPLPKLQPGLLATQSLLFCSEDHARRKASLLV